MFLNGKNYLIYAEFPLDASAASLLMHIKSTASCRRATTNIFLEFIRSHIMEDMQDAERVVQVYMFLKSSTETLESTLACLGSPDHSQSFSTRFNPSAEIEPALRLF